jgi:hypothetical protein
MISTGTFLAVILPTFALVAGAFYALVVMLGQRIDRLDARVDAGFHHVDERFDRVDARFERIESEIAGLRAGLAVVESRLDAG